MQLARPSTPTAKSSYRTILPLPATTTSGSGSSSKERTGSASSSRKVQRAQRFSCELCRKRKIKCDGARPTCNFCKQRNIQCVYLGFRKKENSLTPNDSNSSCTLESDPPPQPPFVPEYGSTLWLVSPSPVSASTATEAQTLPSFEANDPSIPPAHILIMNALRVRNRLMCFPLHRRSLLLASANLQTELHPLVLASLCAFGVEILRLGPSPDLPRTYYERAREIASFAMEYPRMEVLTGLLILVPTDILASSFSVSWMHLGIACQMTMLLKLDVDPDEIEINTGTKMTWLEKETRRRLWWSVFMCDRILAGFLQRPQILSRNDSIKKPCSDEIWDSLKRPETLEAVFQDPSTNTGSSSYYFIQACDVYCQVIQFMSEEQKRLRIIKRIPDITTMLSMMTPERSQQLMDLEGALEGFYKELPSQVMIPGLTAKLLAGHSDTTNLERLDDWFFEEFCNEIGPPWSILMTHVRYHTALIILHRPKLTLLFQAQAQKLMQLQGYPAAIPLELLDTVLAGFESLASFAQIHKVVPLPKSTKTTSRYLKPYISCRASAETISFLNVKLLATLKARVPEPPLFYLDSLINSCLCLILTLLHAHQQTLCDIAAGKLGAVDQDPGFKELFEKYMFFLNKNLVSMKDGSGSMEGISSELVISIDQVVKLLHRLDPTHVSAQEEGDVEPRDKSEESSTSQSQVSVKKKSMMFYELRDSVKDMSQTLSDMILTSSEMGSRVISTQVVPETKSPSATSPVVYSGPFVSSSVANATNEMWMTLSSMFTMTPLAGDISDSSNYSSN